MKNLLFVLVLLTLSSCTRFYAPGAQGRHGPRLDYERAKEDIQKVVINQSKQPIFVDLQGRQTDFIRDFFQVNAGDTLKVTGRSFRNIHVTIAWWCQGCQNRIGYSEEQLLFSMPGLYTGNPIVVTELMLRRNDMMSGYIYNAGDPTWYSDEQGNEFVLETNASAYFSLRSGPVNFWVRPAALRQSKGQSWGSYPYNYLKHYKFVVDLKKNQYFRNGKQYDFQILLGEKWLR